MDNKFINQFPYTDFHELNLDWVIKQTKEQGEQIAYLNEEFSKITVLTEDYIQTMIDTAIESNNLILAQKLIDLKAEITTEYKGYVTAQINALTVYIDNQDVHYDELAQGYANTALNEAKDYTDDAVIDYTMMINPITGVYEDVRNVVDDIVSYFHTGDALTAGEYDALDLTAGAYDAYDITAYDYDFNGKTILNP
ncbi:MAG: hypothetical protein J6T10_14285 [Methanobrevibacter sp.]|nr:hypothetical protein [Methanobrevibacter sp.]